MKKNYDFTEYNLYPEDQRYLTFLKKVFRNEFRINWFKRLSSWMFLEKEFYSRIFWDKLDDNVFLLDLWDDLSYWMKAVPSICSLKAYIDAWLFNETQPVYHYYMDRFYPKIDNHINGIWLFWADVIWENDPIIDAQMIFIVYSILIKLWLEDLFEIRINTIWNKKEQLKYIEELKDFYDNKKHLLSEESLSLLAKGDMLAILNKKGEDEIILAENSPKLSRFLKTDSKKHFTLFKEYLALLKIPYLEDNTITWKYDFINNTIWEFRMKNNWYIISSWFRYDSLSSLMWFEKEISASWFSFDTIKLIDLLKESDIKIVNKDKLQLYFVQLWDEAKKIVIPLSLLAKKAWINTAVSLGTPSIKEQMLKANKSWANLIVIVWFMEAKTWNLQLRNLEDWTQISIHKDDLINYIIINIGLDKLNFYEPSKDLLTK